LFTRRFLTAIEVNRSLPDGPFYFQLLGNIGFSEWCLLIRDRFHAPEAVGPSHMTIYSVIPSEAAQRAA
jgi:hypothetical protein